MNTDYAAYRARALAYYQADGVITTQPAGQAAAMRRLKRAQQITAPLSKDLSRRIKAMVRTGVMRPMPLDQFVACHGYTSETLTQGS
jgi:hypothetical protein